MSNPVYQKTVLVGTSGKSFSEAAAAAVAQASSTLQDVSWFEVVEQRGAIVNGQIQYQVTISVGHHPA